MIESTDNLLQLLLTGISTGICVHYSYTTQKRAWIILGLASASFFLGDLYWQLYMQFYKQTPHSYSDIADLAWYASYLFLFLLLSELQGDAPPRCRSKLLWLIPVFTVGCCVFYMYWGDYITNAFLTIIMTALAYRTVGGLMELRKTPEDIPRMRRVYILMLLICIGEYGSTLVSYNWVGDSVCNPYFWFDTLLSVCYLLLPAAVRKALRE